jgi:hypothetical protein
MDAALHGCLQKGNGLSWGPEFVTFSVFGIKRHAVFTPAVQVELVGATASCPAQ